MRTPQRLLTCLLLLPFAACGEQQPAAVSPPPAAVVDPGPTPLLLVDAGDYQPLFGGRDGRKTIPVDAFLLEQRAVSNAQFLAFVAADPKWRRSRVSPLFADAGYLSSWRADLDPGVNAAELPVTNVSWFAARAYARWRGRRLPSNAEWELAAALPLADGADLTRVILDWYSRPMPTEPRPIGSGTRTATGLQDLHGLVWEWVDDFATAMSTGDARGATDLQRTLFCGAGAVGSTRPDDYAAFMRYAMRSSLSGAHTTRNLGFRCAADRAARK